MRAYVVWQPMLGGKEKHVSDATRMVPDQRATHYWDGPGKTLRSYRKMLELPEPSWDIYMVYGPTARWDETLPPVPDYWMHQLGSAARPRVEGPYLDAVKFAGEARRYLEGTGL